ncbi:MAG TPA: glycoside hydrolase family 43 protein [Anaerolineales bacterium]|nr:glycoside hydrolase family 43 protein [Anaerolineales bacterium]
MDPPTSPSHYHNPVYPQPCPDPFVLKFCGEYWCYSTGLQPDGRFFAILHSTNLVDWRPTGSALDRLPPGTLPYPDDHYWAPEVVYENGRFLMYYSVGDETCMQIRIAVAGHPAGPFVDSGRRLTREDFAIDPHVFTDDDGARYLFYATDFWEHPRIGTGTVVDRLHDPFTPAGAPQPVTRARFDWQVYDPQRIAKGGVRWHTLEGPFVLRKKGRYFQMFSAGNWQDGSYGVAYGVSDRLDGPGEWEQPCDGEAIPPVLRSRPEQGVIGPGHNSVVRGPDNSALFCIYHRWLPEAGARVLALDRLGWEDGRLLIDGPSSGPRPVPPLPAIDGFDGFDCSPGGGRREGNRLHLGSDRRACRPLPEAAAAVLEISLRMDHPFPAGWFGLRLQHDGGRLAGILIGPHARRVRIETQNGTTDLPLPEPFDGSVFHLLRLEIGPEGWAAFLDGLRLIAAVPLPSRAGALDLLAFEGAAEFAGFAFTVTRPDAAQTSPEN